MPTTDALCASVSFGLCVWAAAWWGCQRAHRSPRTATERSFQAVGVAMVRDAALVGS